LARTSRDLLQTFNRLLIWPTLILFILLAISGFGITNPRMTSELTGGVLTPERVLSVSRYMHLNLAAPVLILLMIHVLIGLKNALARWGTEEGRLLNAVIIALGLFAAALIIVARYWVS